MNRPKLLGMLLIPVLVPRGAPAAPEPGDTPLIKLTTPAPTLAPRPEALWHFVNGAWTNTATRVPIVAAPVAREFMPTMDGAAAQFARYAARIAPSPHVKPAVTLTLPDGATVLKWRPAFLAYYDRASGKSVMVAEVREAIGQIHPGARVVFPEAFDDVSADLRLVCGENFIEADVIARAQFPAPEEWPGFSSATTEIQMWTEFYDPPAPRLQSQSLVLRAADAVAGLAEAVAEDATLDFGSAKIVTGTAFTLAEEPAGTGRLPVAKGWVRIPEGDQARYFLVETLDYAALKPKLDQLPKPAVKTASRKVQSDSAALVRTMTAAVKTPNRVNAGLRTPQRVADLQPLAFSLQPSPSAPGVVLDFIIVATTPLPSGAISWWPAGGNANDALTNHNHGCVTNGATYAAGKVGQAFAFDGADDLVIVPNATSLNPSNALTVEAWIYLTATGSDDQVILGKDGVMSNRQYLFEVTLDGALRAHVGISNAFYYFDGTNILASTTRSTLMRRGRRRMNWTWMASSANTNTTPRGNWNTPSSIWIGIGSWTSPARIVLPRP